MTDTVLRPPLLCRATGAIKVVDLAKVSPNFLFRNDRYHMEVDLLGGNFPSPLQDHFVTVSQSKKLTKEGTC